MYKNHQYNIVTYVFSMLCDGSSLGMRCVILEMMCTIYTILVRFFFVSTCIFAGVHIAHAADYNLSCKLYPDVI